MGHFPYKKQFLIVFRETFEQRFEKLRETFWKNSSDLWKALVLLPFPLLFLLLLIVIIIIIINYDFLGGGGFTEFIKEEASSLQNK